MEQTMLINLPIHVESVAISCIQYDAKPWTRNNKNTSIKNNQKRTRKYYTKINRYSNKSKSVIFKQSCRLSTTSNLFRLPKLKKKRFEKKIESEKSINVMHEITIFDKINSHTLILTKSNYFWVHKHLQQLKRF